MRSKTTSRFLVIVAISIVVAIGLGMLLTLLGRGPGRSAPAAASPPASSPPTRAQTPQSPSASEPIVAKINDHAIRYPAWREAALLDQVMSGLAGQPPPTGDDTLQRLINEELLLQIVPQEETPTPEQVEAKIASLEQAWNANDADVVKALEAVGLDRTTLKHAIRRLLAVQTSMQSLEHQGYDIETWLKQQRESADIQVFEDVAKLSPATPLPAAATRPPSPPPTSPTKAAFTSSHTTSATKTPVPAPTVPDIAPEFTLERASGGTFTLTERLAQGPVVLVFFQRCG